MADIKLQLRDADEEGKNSNQHGGGGSIDSILPVSATPLHNPTKLISISENGKVAIPLKSKLLYRLGFEELYSSQVWGASLAELIGTALLVFMIDTIVISSIETNTKTPNIIISCYVALVMTILLLTTTPVSGGHINPAVTLSAALSGLVSISRAMVYIVAQCLGAILGALALKAVLSTSIENNFSLGGCTISLGPNGPEIIGLETEQALWLEILCTFFFLFPVWMRFDHRQLKVLGPIVVSAIIGIAVGLIMFVSTTLRAKKNYAGAGINPARCFGPAIVRGGHIWAGHWVFWVGPIIACLIFHLYTSIISRQHFKPRVNKEYESLYSVVSEYPVICEK